MTWRWACALFAVLAACQACERTGPNDKGKPTITVFAAASTTDIVSMAAERYKQLHGVAVQCSFDSSSSLAKQIRNGAPADIFLSADEKWMDDLQSAGEIDVATRADLLGNELVLIAPSGAAFEAPMDRSFDFAANLPQVSRVAVAETSSVPAGRYAEAALTYFGWWDALESRLLPQQDVRAALRLVERGEADAGIVYATDAKVSTGVTVVGIFPAESHEPIRYPIALCKNGNDEARRFIEFLKSAEMSDMFRSFGFTVLAGGAS
jgi:molybdate transport system substrate-binding protein